MSSVIGSWERAIWVHLIERYQCLRGFGWGDCFGSEASVMYTASMRPSAIKIRNNNCERPGVREVGSPARVEPSVAPRRAASLGWMESHLIFSAPASSTYRQRPDRLTVSTRADGQWRSQKCEFGDSLTFLFFPSRSFLPFLFSLKAASCVIPRLHDQAAIYVC